jgi:glycosyltransferase involved in cell wall biosynthesis
MFTLFFLSVFFVFFGYFGYPISLIIIGIFKKKMVLKSGIYPRVSLIITAHNEEKRINNKLQNTKRIEYPADRIQVIIASDGSIDKTNSIVSNYKNSGFELLEIRERQGKENAQKEAVKIASGEILIFTDVATILEPQSIKSIVSNFADKSIGCVSSVDRIISDDGTPGGEGLYVKYEMWLRNLESKIYSLVGLSGSYFAARKEVCQDFASNMQSDFRTLLNSIKLGLRGVSDPDSIGFYKDIADEQQEFHRKVRTVLRGLTVFFNHLEFLNIFNYGFFSYQYFCHKLLRWLVPIFLGVALVSNMLFIFQSSLYLALFLLQILFYVIGIIQMSGRMTLSFKPLKIPQYFLTVNLSIFVAWIKYLKGDRIVLWQPSKR